jgi:hypothetical protein
MPTCYMCPNQSTSVDHAPPKCFFPAGMRNNLITVPACHVHNEEMSKDDEYARNVITMSIENNKTSIDHFFDKSFKSFQRHPGLVGPIKNSFRDVSSYKEDAKAFALDRARVDRVMRKISYALFYHEYNYTWEKELAVLTNQIKMTNMTNDHLGDLFETLTDDLNELTLQGNNPSVFQYSFIDSGPGQFDKALFMIFYEGFPIWIIPAADSDRADFN